MIETSQLSGLEGNFQAEPRVFAHDAKPIVIGAINNSAANHGIRVTNKGGGYQIGDTINLIAGAATGATAASVRVLSIVDGAATGPVQDYDIAVTPGSLYAINEVITGGGGFACVITNIDIPNTQQRGCCLYIGAAGNISVIMEGGTEAITFSSLAAGTFLPILVTRITAGTSLIALY